jgi:signal transduction histidine kinase
MLAVLESTRDRFGDRAAGHGRRITLEAPDDLAVMADPLRLRQALGNLVDNALRHGAGDIVLTARAAAHGVEIDVRDQGPGFGSDLADRAFERFTRAGESRSGGGAGLGLAIVRAIAKAHGGEALIVEDPRGTTVRLLLPAVGPGGTAADDMDREASHAPLI